MTFVGFITGGFIGTGLHMFSLGIMKVPLSRMPWGHVGLFALGGYVGHNYPKWKQNLLDEANIQRALRGQPPLNGTQSMLGKRYA